VKRSSQKIHLPGAVFSAVALQTTFPPSSVLLWTLAAVFVAAALADVPILGFDGAMLSTLAAVFSAVAGGISHERTDETACPA